MRGSIHLEYPGYGKNLHYIFFTEKERSKYDYDIKVKSSILWPSQNFLLYKSNNLLE